MSNKFTFTLFLIFFLIACLRTKAQVDCSNNASNCDKDLRDQINLDGYSTVRRTYGKSTEPAEYSDVYYKYDCGNTGSSHCNYDPNDDLYYDVYYPNNVDFSTCKFPCAILFHGGGFRDCSGIESGSDVTLFAHELCLRGFVVFVCEYRRGNLEDYYDFYTNPSYTSAQQQLAIYRACQDGRGAVRTILKREIDQQNSTITDDFQFDTNKVFIGGVSAGAIIALNVGYYHDQAKMNLICPGVEDVLGPIDVDYYHSDPSYDYAPKIKGVISMWGCVFAPPTYDDSNLKSFLLDDNSYNAPLIAFHGKEDNRVPIGMTLYYFAPNNTYYPINDSTLSTTSIHRTSKCLINDEVTFILDPIGEPFEDIHGFGSESLYTAFYNKGIKVEEYIDCDMHHGLDADGSGYASDFGVSANTDRATTNAYLAARVATFFQSIMNTVNLTGTKRFVECKNKRNKCSASDNDDTCENSDQCP